MFYEQPIDQDNAVPKGKSPARVAAGSRNGKLAAGKKSPAGLAASSQNAQKHGYYSRTFTTLGTENKDLYNEIRDALREEYEPANIREHQLLEIVAQYNWLLNRNFNLENNYLNKCIASVILESAPQEDLPINVVACTVDGYEKAAEAEKPITLIYRQRGQLQRELARSAKSLETLVELRRKAGRHASTLRPKFQDANAFVSQSEALEALGIISDVCTPLKTNELLKISRNEGNGHPESPQDGSNHG